MMRNMIRAKSQETQSVTRTINRNPHAVSRQCWRSLRRFPLRAELLRWAVIFAADVGGRVMRNIMSTRRHRSSMRNVDLTYRRH